MSHPCPVKGCERPAKDQQLMCWPHWRRVPRPLNKAIFETFANGPRAEYSANVKEAIRVVEEKEASA